MKLLIADDQTSLHTFLDKTMDWTTLGITEIKHAYDGRETLQQLGEFLPDIVILDIQMPFMSGIETLQQLDHSVKKPKTIIVSAHDEFAYAQEALRLDVYQYLLKPVDVVLLKKTIHELSSAIQAEQQSILAHEFGKLVHSKSMHANSLAAVGRASCLLKLKQCAVLHVEGESLSEPMLSEWLLQAEPTLIPVVYRKSRDKYSCLLGITTPLSESRLLELCQETLSRIQESASDLAVSIGVSRRMNGCHADKLPKLLEESEEAGMLSFYTCKPVNAYQGEAFNKAWGVQHFQTYEQAYREMVVHEFAPEAARELTAEMFDYFRSSWIPPEDVYSLVLHFLYVIAQSIPPMGRSSAKLDNITMDDLKSYRNVQELELLFMSLIDHIASIMKGPNLTEDMVMRVKQYVDLNYGEDLSLQMVADRFGVDRFQLSRLFKQEMNVNYWNYVIQIRMEKAAELLLRTEEKNSMIASVTGFVDESHFSRTFKKYYDVSPKQYRQLHRGEKL
ncbi:response regulator transcription factor [Paenibacillus bouchesdurhonensis]|uniref:response regulator transcription factor n=1 Tax=Paenibacillus bouchesdurhonensis TaxID=1870990 RepID=UPI000DA6080B|nr:response regulator [Paenibacillus bouchesdurhonensis]